MRARKVIPTFMSANLFDACYTCVMEMKASGSRAVEFVSGSAALDLVDTVASRADAPRDLLSNPSDLARWLKEASLVQSLVPTGEDLLEEARVLREAVFRTASRAIDDKPPALSDRSLLNGWASQNPLAPQLTRAGVVTWRAEDPGRAALVTIARDAVVLVGSDLRRQLRRCEGCSMIFVDRSRPGKRRWCSSAAGCGNKERLDRSRSKRAGRKK